jgi:uncharacterized delta-60 repeat protein
VFIQTDGKILVGGSSNGTFGSDFSLLRLNTDGTIDPNFNGGRRLIVFNGNENAWDMTVQADGKILLAGTTHDGSVSQFRVVRINANGTVDFSFSGDGFSTVPISNTGEGNIAVQNDGKILLSGYGYSTNGRTLVRLTANGDLDTSFDGDGTFVYPSTSTVTYRNGGVNLLADGKILLSGSVTTNTASGNVDDVYLLRLTSSGSLDTTLNGSGKVEIPVGSIDTMSTVATVDNSGKILIASTVHSSNYSYELRVIRTNSNGTLDTTFNGTGKAEFVFPPKVYVASMVVQSDGKIVISGNSGSGEFASLRINSDGSLDTGFGGSTAQTVNEQVSYTENSPAVQLDSSVAIYDPELAALNNGVGNYSGASFSLTRQGGASADDVFVTYGNLSFVGGQALLSGNLIGNVSNSSGTLTLTFGTATQAQVNEVLSSIGYANRSDAAPSSLVLKWTFADGNAGGTQGSGGIQSVIASETVNISKVNDAPTFASSDQTGKEILPFWSGDTFGDQDQDSGRRQDSSGWQWIRPERYRFECDSPQCQRQSRHHIQPDRQSTHPCRKL